LVSNLTKKDNAQAKLSISYKEWVIGQGTYSDIASGSYFGGFYKENTATNNDGDYFTVDVPLQKGTWTLSFIYMKAGSGGIIDVYVDSVEVHSLDTYNAATQHALYQTVTGITIATTGIHTIKMILDGKNGSSGGYYMDVGHIFMTRTGD